nr:melanoma-associated antigen B1-like [Odocoileus virginianus texanus]
MPRRQKSKVRGHETRHQAQAETQGLHDQATTSRGEETTSSSPPDLESVPSSSSAAGTPKVPQGVQGTTSAAAGAIPKRPGVGAAARSRAGVSAAACSRAGVGATAHSRAGVGAAAHSRAGVSAAACSRAGVGAAACSRAGVGVAARSIAGVSAAACSRAGVGAAARSRAGVGAATRSIAGVSAAAWSRAGVGAAARSVVGVSATACSRAGVSATAWSRAGVSATACSRAGVGAAARSIAGVSATAWSRAGVGAAAHSRAGVSATARLRAGVSFTACSRAGVGAEGQGQGDENSSQASAAAESSHTDPLTKNVQVLVQKMLYKHKLRELIKRSEMLKAINKRYREQFPEIFRRAAEHIEIVFGLVLKEVRPNGHSYILVSNLDLSDSESMRSDRGLPKNGLLMPLLGVIYLNGRRLAEEEVWKILNFLGVYDGRRHFIFGDTRKFLTEDLVREGYLKYHRVPGSDPPRYEFLLGPRALMETNRMKILKFMAKVNETVPAAFLDSFEEPFRQEVESTRARDVASIGTSASGRAGTSVWDNADTYVSVWEGPSAAAQAEHPASVMPRLSAAASAGPSASASAQARAASSWSPRP